MGILEDVTLKLRLQYISDLRFLEDTSVLKACINAIPEEKYRLHEWNEAAKYLLGEETIHTTKKTAKKSILEQ